MTDGIRLITEADLPKAAQALGNAFMNDPLQGYTFPNEAERKLRSPAHFTAALKYAFNFGEVYFAENGAGAAVWLKPGETEMSPERAETAGFNALPEAMGADAFERFFSVIEFAEAYHKRDVPEPHWYTMVVGVDPAFQGQGVGRALLKPVMDKSRAGGVPIYLETAQPANVAFYEYIGFKQIRELDEPSSGLRLWTFRLDP
jgi:GNAT superfamily N-acetyltransferase